MSTATEAAEHRDRYDRETVRFNRMVQDFIEHYQPRDLRERATFAADVISLMRQSSLHQAEIHERVIRAALGPMMPLSHSFPLTINPNRGTTYKEPPNAEKQQLDEAGPGQQPGAPGGTGSDVLGGKEVPE